MRADIDDDLVAGQQTDSAVIQGDLDSLRADEAAAAHDQFGAAFLVSVQVECDLPVDHVLLAAAHLAHVGSDVIGQGAEMRGVAHQMGDPGAPEFVLGRQAGDGGAGTADPATLYHGDFLAGLAEMPREQLSTLAAAQDDDIEVFGLRHSFSSLVTFAMKVMLWKRYELVNAGISQYYACSSHSVARGLTVDWLSHLLAMMPVAGRLDLRCLYGAPWRIDQAGADAGAIAYHTVLAGAAILEDPAGGPPHRLTEGDILLLPSGKAHTLHDGNGMPPVPAYSRPALNLVFSENAGPGERLDMLCGHFLMSPHHTRLLRAYLPPLLIVRGASEASSPGQTAAGAQVRSLIAMMRTESDTENLGGRAMLNAFSAALFTLTLRLASEAAEAPSGLLSLAGHPRLAPALTAMFQEPARAWTLPELARLCHMSRATLARHFRERLDRSAADLLLDIRMTLAASELKKPLRSTAHVAELAGYQSESAFLRVFKSYMGVTPAQWRRAARIADVDTEFA